MKALLLLCALAGAAHADPDHDIALPRTKVVLHLAPGWTAIEATPPMFAAAKKDGAVLAVMRAQVPNADAWRAKTRDAYLDQIERGIATTIPGWKRTSHKRSESHGVPTIDLAGTRRGGAIVTIRVLVFRTYALSLAIEGGSADDVKAMVTAFAPPA